MKNVLLIADVSNLYVTTQKKHGAGSKVSYKALTVFAAECGHLVESVAYGSIVHNNSKPFIDYLRANGYKTVFKKAKELIVNGTPEFRKSNYVADVVIACLTRDFDTLVLASSDADYASLVEHLVRLGKTVVVLGSGIPVALKNCATQCIELPGSFLHREDR